MKNAIRAAAPPPKPWLVFDGDCNFCSLWIRRWQRQTGEAVEYLPAQDPRVAAQFPEIPRPQFDTAVQLIETDGTVYSGAEAVFRALAKNPRRQWPLNAYASSPAIADLTEWGYRLVAQNRTLFSRVTRWMWGAHVEPADYSITRWIFLRLLGLVYLVAFVSLWTQVTGLVGHDGILPADQYLSAVQQQCDAQGVGWERYQLLPTLCWLDPSDGFLRFQCAAGTILAGLVVFDVAPVPGLALLWLLYLSLVTIGQDFLGFQWDNLLLEAGFLAIFFAPLQWRPRLAAPAPSRLVLWLFRLLLFKLMFSSGCVKLLSHDPAWRNLTALTFHYHSQPLPTWPAWYASQLPLWFQKFSCAAMFATELGAPWLIFAPRRIRFLGAAALAFLQVLIMVTGNYTFFNWLALALCLLLLDDFVFQSLLPRKISERFPRPAPLSWWHGSRLPGIAVAIVFAGISLFQLASLLGSRSSVWQPAAFLESKLAPFRTINRYGLFAEMTTNRYEIVVEGSNDGTNWLAYGFKYKPGDVHRRPAFVAPFQPRLDWQMWFAALGNYQENPWFVHFCERLLQGSPDVLALLGKNPFPKKPPVFIRARLYLYQFTDFAERRATGAWWRREPAGEYLPPVSLRNYSGSATD